MKKLFFLLFAVIAFSTHSKANYSDGYDCGYHFGWEIVTIIVDTHPEYGMTQNPSSYSSWNDSAWNAGVGLPTYIQSGTVSSNFEYDFFGSYSAFAAAEVAIWHLWQTGAYDWLMSQASVSSWHLGLYEGFYDGTYARMWAYQ